MLPSSARLSMQIGLVSLGVMLTALLACSLPAQAQSAHVRVSQVGYEIGEAPFRAYLMSTEAETGATFKVLNSKGVSVFSGRISGLLGTWSHSKTMTYQVYALDFRKAACIRFR
jgi:endoglucanase